MNAVRVEQYTDRSRFKRENQENAELPEYYAFACHTQKAKINNNLETYM